MKFHPNKSLQEGGFKNPEARCLLNKYCSSLISHICTTLLDCKWEFYYFTWQTKPNKKKTTFEKSQCSQMCSPVLSGYTHHLNTKGGWVHGRVVSAAVPCVFPPPGMKYSLIDLNKLFRTFLSQSEKMLFTQAVNEAIHHLVWCCSCS